MVSRDSWPQWLMGCRLKLVCNVLPDVRASALSSTCCSDVGEKIGEI